MKISDMPEFKNRTKVLTCGPDETVYDAVVAMSQRHCGSIIVVDEDDNMIGIFTERDLLARVVANGCDIEKIAVGEVMSTNIETASSDASILLTMGRMHHGRFRHVPVVSDKGKLLGILSQNDFVAHSLRVMTED